MFGYATINKLTLVDTTSFGVNAFASSSVQEVIIPSSVKVLKDGIFTSCTSLKTVTFSEGLTDIKSSAFKNCTALETVILPSTVTNIGKQAFAGCISLKNVIVPNPDAVYDLQVFDGDINLTLCSESGSTTETYAKENNISFEVCHVSGQYQMDEQRRYTADRWKR